MGETSGRKNVPLRGGGMSVFRRVDPSAKWGDFQQCKAVATPPVTVASMRHSTVSHAQHVRLIIDSAKQTLENTTDKSRRRARSCCHSSDINKPALVLQLLICCHR